MTSLPDGLPKGVLFDDALAFVGDTALNARSGPLSVPGLELFEASGKCFWLLILTLMPATTRQII